MRRVEENQHASSLQLSKEVDSQTGVTISRDTIRCTLHILWSDETKINVFGTDGFKTVWHRKGEEYKGKCMVPTVKHGGGSVLMWGCMSAAGVGELHFIDGIMN